MYGDLVWVMNFADFTARATAGMRPYPYQVRLAGEGLPDVLNVPTGAGKTLASVLPWLYRRINGVEDTRWLVVVLPQRSLVEQTTRQVRQWLGNLDLDVQLYQELGKLKPEARLVLLHSRFRPADRHEHTDAAVAATNAIVVSTQVLEAGVDLTSRTLIIELAPWSSIDSLRDSGRNGRTPLQHLLTRWVSSWRTNADYEVAGVVASWNRQSRPSTCWHAPSRLVVACNRPRGTPDYLPGAGAGWPCSAGGGCGTSL
jgi:hypothetical protein